MCVRARSRRDSTREKGASWFLKIITAFWSFFFSRLLLIYLGVWRKRSWELGCCLRHRQIPLYREMASFVSLLYLDL